MEKIGIVILNYLNYKDTIECVESLKDETYLNKEVIIVDNGSNNESWEELNKVYKDKKIHLVKSDENLGFARGNNIGIKYATEKLGCSFVLLVNNDTIFIDKNLLANMIDAYEEGVGLIGPRIISADNMEQNPVPVTVSKEAIKNEYIVTQSMKHKIRNSEAYINSKTIKFLKLMKKNIKNILKGKPINGQISEISENKESLDLVLHGACVMLTKDYFKYYPALFPNTFLYYEENILTLLTKKVGLTKKFINNTKIYHKEDQSSKMSFNNLNSVKNKYLFDSMAECEKLFDLTYDDIIKKYSF